LANSVPFRYRAPIGDIAPNFTVASTTSPSFSLYEYIEGKWAVLFSHPADFTPICTTELGAVQRYVPEFEKRNVKVVALSVDPVDKHNEWIKDINETQNVTISYPIVADEKRTAATTYGMLDQTNINATGLPLTVRSLFVIDPSKKIRLILSYPASCGRNFDEIIRVLDSLQLTDSKKVVTPANWKKGDDVVIAPSVTNDQAKELFGDFKQLKPYLRLVSAAQVEK